MPNPAVKSGSTTTRKCRYHDKGIDLRELPVRGAARSGQKPVPGSRLLPDQGIPRREQI